MFLALFVVLSVLFCGIYLPGQVLFSNDGPLGRLMSECHQLPGRFAGCWEDLSSVGLRALSAAPNISYTLQFLLGPIWFAKLYAIIALVILGFGAWCFFRQSGLSPVACVLGGIAAALNSSFFSVACWGVASHTITVGLTFFALAALADVTSPRRWLRVVLAGFAVGMGVSEGADVGALFSLLVAAYVVYFALVREGSRIQNIASGLGRTILVAGCAAVLGAEAITGLVSTDIEGVVGMEQDAKTHAARWNWATQWSLPKREVLALAVPGLFGYRMDTKDGGAYWGGVGRDLNWDGYRPESGEKPPKGFKRFSGGGSYAGAVVLLFAFWGATQALRFGNSSFKSTERRLLWFWIVVALVCLLLALGRFFEPLYRLVYMLPYFSTMRNPVKFLNIFSFAIVVLFAYGVESLWRTRMQPATHGGQAHWSGLTRWWSKGTRFDKRWLVGCLVVLGLSVLGWWIYSANSISLQSYMKSAQVDEDAVPDIAAFSIRQVGWFVLFFGLGTGLLALFLSGAFAGRRAGWGTVFLGLLVAADLGRANLPWILYWNYPQKYATNPIIDELRDKPYTHRVCFLPFNPPPQVALFSKVYQSEWLPHLFSYYNIQTIEVVQMSRLPEDLVAFEKMFHPQTQEEFSRMLSRLWQLTNNRYLLGAAGFVDALNQRIDPAHRPFRIVERFALEPRPGILHPERVDELTAVIRPDGPYALVEFSEALPRAKLYGSWIVNTNAQAALNLVASPSFDPNQSVIVSGGLPAAAINAGTNQNTGTVDFASYDSKNIVLKSQASTPSVLLLNDHFDLHWKVQVDGQTATLLRCNSIMRGVYLEPGAHTVEFHFRPPMGPLYVSVAAIGIAVLLLGIVMVGEYRAARPVEKPREVPARPQPSAAPVREAVAAGVGGSGGKRKAESRKEKQRR